MTRNSRSLCLIARIMLAAVIPSLLSGAACALPGRVETDLSGSGWRLWLDQEAEWRNDPLFPPPVDIVTLPSNPPTCGWDDLPERADKTVAVPGTVEEHFWGGNGNPTGIAGDYRGVSWWSRTFTLEPSREGKRIILAFDSVNLRAEVYVNRTLVGYDVVGNTPFEVDITRAVKFGEPNSLDIRVTDPSGNFTWEDNDMIRWGNHRVPGVHGYGGITGRVRLLAVDPVRISDVYVENKPDVKEIDVFVTLENTAGATVNGDLYLAVVPWPDTAEPVWKKSIRVSVPPEGAVRSMHVKAGNPRLWSVREPNLYVAATAFVSGDKAMVDSMNRRFGFRYFTAAEKDGDRRFHLNGDRVFLFAAMTRGFWPKNGIFPTPEMARRDIEATLDFGFNMMLFHRAIGQPEIIERCDEAGLLVYEEPGGYRCTPEPTPEARILRREKLRRMVIRGRSNPSVVIYNLKNEASDPPSDDDIANMVMVHDLDPGRIITYNSDRNRTVDYDVRLEKDPFKLHLLPFDDELREYGWFDHHHWFRHPGYVDDIYENPRFFLRGVVNHPTSIVRADSLNRLDPGEIIFWGEEGQWGTMMRLGAISEDIRRTGATGFREKQFLSWRGHYERFLDESGFRRFFPAVDDMILSMGRSLHYFHGRVLENVRMGNVSDGYNLNGWAAPETSEDIVSLYRHPTADPSILSRYARPLYVAVKLRDKVAPLGFSPTADFFIVNEENVRGDHILTVTCESPDGAMIFSRVFPAAIAGGGTFGQLLAENVELPAVSQPGYYTVKAVLTGTNGVPVADGSDDLFAVDLGGESRIPVSAAVIDTSGVVNGLLHETRAVELATFDPDAPPLDLIVLGAHDYDDATRPHRSRYISAVMDRVANGATLVILDEAERWASGVMNNLFRHQAVDFVRTIQYGTDGRFIAGDDPVLDGLPVRQAMHWEYQIFYMNGTRGIEMDSLGVDTIVALACENRKDIVDALTRVPFGNGEIYLTTLDMLPALSSQAPQAAVAKKLFLNLLETPRRKPVWRAN